ncbi:tubulin polyglutamylase [Acrasis kona]|uniref:Tubulin--tyrosine ligase-like protein 9 n=1 Tax=Acrasis kona TaxID=1008807 RepID=A0AAW2ZI22_9EUKA
MFIVFIYNIKLAALDEQKVGTSFVYWISLIRKVPSTPQLGTPARPIRFRTGLHNTLFDVLKDRGYKFTDSELDWDLHWADVGWVKETLDHLHLEEYQRINHFRNHYELTRKDLLVKNLKRMKKILEKEEKYDDAKRYNFSPTSYVLPQEYGLFTEEYKRTGGVYIMKPIGKSQGKGIFLFNKLSQISEWKKEFRYRSTDQQAPETYIAQKYVENPYLVGGKKFDLRIYVLVTSYNPLTVYLYRTGFARFSQFRFSMDLKGIDNNFVHLTNVAIQKTTQEYHDNVVKSGIGCKWDLRRLKLFMCSKHGVEAVDTCFTGIQELCLRSLLAVQRVIIQDKHCFEMYGYDILIDDELKPWLLEVNASPSLTADTPEDYQMKHALLDDVFTIIDMEKRLTGTEDHIGGWDIICRGKVDFQNMKPSLLGAFNEREKNLAQLRKKRKASSVTTSAANSNQTKAK